MVVIGQGGCILAEVVVLVNSGLFGQKWLHSGKNGCIRAKWLYSGKTGCIGVQVVVFGKK